LCHQDQVFFTQTFFSIILLRLFFFYFPATDINRNSLNIVNGPQPSANYQDVRVVVTTAPTLPNLIPVSNGAKGPLIHVSSPRPYLTASPTPTPSTTTLVPKVTAQQILHQQMLNKKKAIELERMRATTKRPRDKHVGNFSKKLLFCNERQFLYSELEIMSVNFEASQG